ncbi:hypothetical protein O3M35_000852 [Rhynocoris fuscipes]|uniref:Uncharacterized protein n=1 Tax=Rhynocoris fuscipes TaxID=488301 RepID=A0AAW1DTE9_9HEMI
MNKVIHLLFLIAIILLAINISNAEELKEMMEKVVTKCREKYDLEISEIETAIKERKLPESDKGKDFLGCIIKEVGIQQFRKAMAKE